MPPSPVAYTSNGRTLGACAFAKCRRSECPFRLTNRSGTSGRACAAQPEMAVVQIRSTAATARARLVSNGHQPDVRIAPGGLAPWQERTSPAASDQRADVGERDGPLDRARVGHVTWHPFGIELLLVEAHPLEVVP